MKRKISIFNYNLTQWTGKAATWVKRQHFKGYFTIEYEADWENNLPRIKESIRYFDQVSNDILDEKKFYKKKSILLQTISKKIISNQ